MDRWPHPVGSYSMHTILVAVKDDAWQKFRESLKGFPTSEKLDMLDEYRTAHKVDLYTSVRVDNYINALRRGGQLDLDNNVTERP